MGDGGEGPGVGGSSGSTPIVYCDAQAVSFQELADGAVRLGATVSVDATATSQKFLVSHASSGSCLFGAYVGVEPEAGEPRGLLIVSYGEDALADAPCPSGKDGIPDDLRPGDRVIAAGRFSSYVPSSCDGTAESPQLLVDATCPLFRNGTRAPPAAVTLSFEQADRIALGADAALLRRYSGGLVRLENVEALPNDDGTGVVGPYGVIRLAETRLPVTNDIGYGDLSLGGPGDPEKSLRFGYPTRFRSVIGLVHLDYCTWSLAPRGRCQDLDPASAACP